MTASVVGSLGIVQGPGGGGTDTGVQISNSALAGSPDAPPTVAAPANDEFTSTVLASKWSFLNQQPTGAGNPQASAAFDGITNLALSIPALASGSGNTSIFSLIGQPISRLGGGAVPWAVTAKLAFGVPVWAAATPATGPNGQVGIALYESATGKIVLTGPDQANGIGCNFGTALNNPTVTNSFPIGPSTLGYQGYMGPAFYLRASQLASTYYLWVSWTGRSWTLLTSFTLTTHFTTAADTIGLGFSQRSTSSPITLYCDWFRDTTAQLAP
jgi:hypothetical protein